MTLVGSKAPQHRNQSLCQRWYMELLVEGSSMRSASRVVGCSLNTVVKLLEDVGQACEVFHDEHVRGVRSRNLQCERTRPCRNGCPS